MQRRRRQRTTPSTSISWAVFTIIHQYGDNRGSIHRMGGNTLLQGFRHKFTDRKIIDTPDHPLVNTLPRWHKKQIQTYFRAHQLLWLETSHTVHFGQLRALCTGSDVQTFPHLNLRRQRRRYWHNTTSRKSSAFADLLPNPDLQCALQSRCEALAHYICTKYICDHNNDSYWQ